MSKPSLPIPHRRRWRSAVLVAAGFLLAPLVAGCGKTTGASAPTRRNEITGQPFGDTENVFVATGPGRIGATYLTCLYRQYTDAIFTTLVRRSGNDTSLGLPVTGWSASRAGESAAGSVPTRPDLL